MIEQIKKIQAFLKLTVDGVIGPKTLKAIGKFLGCGETVEEIQRALGVKDDGDFGPVTLNALFRRLPSTPEDHSQIPQAAIDMILDAEGIDQPWKWPGGGSGISLGYGCDIGADPGSLVYWSGVLKDFEVESLRQALGKVGRDAAQIQTRFKSINVTKDQALTVFKTRTLPKEIVSTTNTFPGVEKLPSEVLGALVSLVYNRGTELSGDRRKEMKTIHDLIVEYAALDNPNKVIRDKYIRKIANQFVAMKRLWVGQGLDGLLARRDAEANLCLSAI